jgi:hypothetical protein
MSGLPESGHGGATYELHALAAAGAAHYAVILPAFVAIERRRREVLTLQFAAEQIDRAVADLVAAVELGREHLKERYALRWQQRTRELHDGGELRVAERERWRWHG